MDVELMVTQLALHEGIRLKVYQDTLGIDTVLCGYNVEARGWDFVARTLGRPCGPATAFTREDALAVLRADVARIEATVRASWPTYARLSPVRQRVVIDMAFNLGRGVMDFRRAKAAVEASNWSGCARELYKSRWAGQVDDGEGGKFGRADRLVTMILTNQEPSDPEWLAFLRTFRS